MINLKKHVPDVLNSLLCPILYMPDIQKSTVSTEATDLNNSEIIDIISHE